MLSYSRNSRFAPNCEPMNPLGRCRAKQSRSGSSINGYSNSNRVTRKDIYEETYDFVHDVLGEIQGRYDKASEAKGSKTQTIVTMKNNLSTMENRVRKIGLDPQKDIQDSENNASIKKKIISDIRKAQNLVTLIEIPK